MAITKVRGNTQIIDETIFDAQIAPSAGIQTSKLADGQEFVKRDGSIPFTGNVDMGGNKVTNVAPGTAPSDLVTFAQLQSISAGLDPKQSVRLATDGDTSSNVDIDLTTGGLLTIDGVLTVSGNRILVKNQDSNPEQNGIYIVSAGAWLRATDADVTGDLTSGSYVFIEEGIKYDNTGWLISTDGTITIGTTPIQWVQFTAAGGFSAGEGLGQVGNVVNVLYDDSTIGLNGSNQVYLKDLSVSTSKIVNDAVDKTKINADIAGLGLIQAIGGELNVNVDGSTIEIDTDTLRVKDAGITLAKLANLSSAKIIVGNASNRPTAVDVSGDATIDNTGALSIVWANVWTNMIFREIPTGAINGTNKIYSLLNVPVSGTEQVFLNGILQNVGASNDYTISGGTITFNDAPKGGGNPDIILVHYIKQ